MFSRPIRPTIRPTATTLPYDVLREIFLNCLPEEPLNRLQPNIQEAPMLLCSVCSNWRKAALASPSLWSHIYYHLPIRWDASGRGLPMVWDLDGLATDMEFLKWWRENQGSMAPFIRFQFCQDRKHRFESEECYLEGDVMKFFIEYLSSAQYLDVGPFARYLFRQDIPSKLPVAAPNLHTLVAFYEGDAFANISGQIHFPTVALILPFHIAPTLKRLTIHVEGPLSRAFANSFADWSRLTHLSIHEVIMLPDVWSSLIRGVVNLQWGFFCIALAPDQDGTRVHPSKSILPFLSTLSLQAYKRYNWLPHLETLVFLMQNLHLPALHNLRIYANVDSMDLSGGIMSINDILKSAPAVRDLTLGLNFDPAADFNLPSVDWEVVEQISGVASALTHLQLDITFTRHPWDKQTIEGILAVWKKVLSPKGWLNPRSPTNKIREITVFILHPLIYGRLVKSTLRHILALDDGEQGNEPNDIVLEVVHVDDTRDPSDEWRTWAARYVEGPYNGK